MYGILKSDQANTAKNYMHVYALLRSNLVGVATFSREQRQGIDGTLLESGCPRFSFSMCDVNDHDSSHNHVMAVKLINLIFATKLTNMYKNRN